MERKIRVLFLPRWYPGPSDPMPGLFIQRQAEAITPWCDVAVIHVQPDPQGPEEVEAQFSEENGVRVLRIRYRTRKRPGPLKWRDALDYNRACMKAFNSIRQFAPDLVHAHILTRAAFIGRKIARRQKIPLVISEHWSRYFPENGSYSGLVRKLVTKFILAGADALVPVSESLRAAMAAAGLSHRLTKVIPNVVGVPLSIQEQERQTAGPVHMIHISCFEDRSKNISGFLRSVKALSEVRKDFTCTLVGEGPDLAGMKDYAAGLGLEAPFVKFSGLLTGDAFWETLQQSNFSVVSSRYETFGTVVIESLACGVPVVATRTGIAAEVIDDSNGILVEPGDESGLTAALDQMIGRYRVMSPARVRDSVGDRFSASMVGKQILGLYSEVLGKDNHRR